MALFLAWSYSAPPLTLHSRGLGELTTAVLVAVSVPLLAFYLQTGRLDDLPLLASVPLFFLQFGMLLLVELPDERGDAEAGKRTLVVRLGAHRASLVYLATLLATYTTLPLLVLAGLPVVVALAVACISPLALWLGWQLARGAWAMPARWETLCFWGIGLLMGTAGAELVAFVIIGR
jgi:1,4-dihydroxy-2-naphthoate octaprenyltransferase